MRRTFLLGAILVTGLMLLAPMVVMKVVEGVFFVFTITANSLRQAWKNGSGEVA